MKRALAAIALTGCLIIASNAAAQDAGRLHLNVETGTETGSVMIALYDSEAAYEGGAPSRVAHIDIENGERTAVFEGLALGDYGIKAFHDVNNNGKMDTNPFGMPVEPYAFSNNAVGNMGPAKWDRARFTVDGPTQHSLKLR